MVKPLEETILMHELYASTARAWVPKRVLRVARVPADPADVLLLIIVIVPSRNSIHRRRGSRLRLRCNRSFLRSGGRCDRHVGVMGCRRRHRRNLHEGRGGGFGRRRAESTRWSGQRVGLGIETERPGRFTSSEKDRGRKSKKGGSFPDNTLGVTVFLPSLYIRPNGGSVKMPRWMTWKRGGGRRPNRA